LTNTERHEIIIGHVDFIGIKHLTITVPYEIITDTQNNNDTVNMLPNFWISSVIETHGAIKNGQSREIGNIEYISHKTKTVLYIVQYK